MPRSWSVLIRVGQGFATGLAVGVFWALWVIRRRRPGAGSPALAGTGEASSVLAAR